jgi:uncharacterized protein (DUF1501 family)
MWGLEGVRSTVRTVLGMYFGIHAASLHDTSFSHSEAAEAISGCLSAAHPPQIHMCHRPKVR